MRLGEYDWTNNAERLPHNDYRIQRAATYEGFSLPNSYLEDIGLIRLTQKVRFQAHIKPIGLARLDGPFLDTTAKVTGWGLTNPQAPRPTRSAKLQEIYMRIRLYDNIHLVTRAVRYHGPCFGDSGGPLTVLHHNKRLLVGVFIRHQCGDHTFEARYMRVSVKVNWIRTTMNRLSRRQ